MVSIAWLRGAVRRQTKQQGKVELSRAGWRLLGRWRRAGAGNAWAEQSRAAQSSAAQSNAGAIVWGGIRKWRFLGWPSQVSVARRNEDLPCECAAQSSRTGRAEGRAAARNLCAVRDGNFILRPPRARTQRPSCRRQRGRAGQPASSASARLHVGDRRPPACPSVRERVHCTRAARTAQRRPLPAVSPAPCCTLMCR